MNAPCRLAGVLAVTTALLAPAAASDAAVPGVNVTFITADGDPRAGWQQITDSGAKTVRSFVDVGTLKTTHESRSGSSPRSPTRRRRAACAPCSP